MLMPKMTGLGMLRNLRADERSRQDEIQEVMTLGVAWYLMKAILSPQELCDQVIAILHGKVRG
jgi:DNA-binding NarL/FixJ family response regulator